METVAHPATDRNHGGEVRLLTRAEVQDRTGLSTSNIYKQMRAEPPTFPLAVKLGGSRSIRWRSDEIDRWIDGLTRATGDLLRSSVG